MKNSTLLLFLIAFLVLSCNKKEKELTLRNQELTQVVEQRDSIIGILNNTLDEIEKNLGVISSSGATRNDLKERMRRDISHINNLIESNQNRYDSLKRIVSSGRNRSGNLSKRMDTLNMQLNERENRIAELNEQIAILNNKINYQDQTIGNLQSFSTDQESTIDRMIRRLNTAYFIVGEEKDLVEKNVVYKDGGFLGIFGRVDRLNPQFNNNLFTQIDIRDDQIIEIKKENGKDKISLVTIHPSQSYNIKDVNDEMAQVEITDPQSFWEASKYLVVMKE